MTSLRSGVKWSMKKIGIIGCILCLGPISYLLLQGFTFLQSIEPLVVPFGICVVLIIIGIIREKKMTMEEKMNRERD